MDPLAEHEWNARALAARVISVGQSLRDFQVLCSNWVIRRIEDVVVIAPTGIGKSHLWVLPLLAQRNAISLVITPYTSLGLEGEARYVVMASLSLAGTYLF